MFLTIKLGRVVTYLEGVLPIKSLDPLITWYWRSNDKSNTFYLYTVMPMATKLGWWVRING